MALFIMWGLVHSASKHSTLLSAGHVSEPTGALPLELKDVQRPPQAYHTDKHVTYDRNSTTLLFPFLPTCVTWAWQWAGAGGGTPVWTRSRGQCSLAH